MRNLSALCGEFFKNFPLEGQTQRAKGSDIRCFENALNDFLGSGKREDAFSVYFCFCEIFNVFGRGYENTKKLLEMLSDHEYHSGELLAKHRDHYSHSVYVFCIGLAIYANDGLFRRTFNDFYGYGEEAASSFLQFWGLTSLFHDVGYPFQLAHEQVKNYCEEIWGKSGENPFVSYGNLDAFLALDEDKKEKFDPALPRDIGSLNGLLAYGLSLRMHYRPEGIETLLKERVVRQPKFMDHAYFSAVLLARKLLSVPDFRMTERYLDVLTAILLHNNFNKYEIPNRRPVSAAEHPLSYLLILCDELQSWDRMAYGKISKRDPVAWTALFEIGDGAIQATYVFDRYLSSDCAEGAPSVFNKNYLEMQRGEFAEKIVGSQAYGKRAGEGSFEGYIVPSTTLTVCTLEQKKEERFSDPFSSDSTFLNLYDLAKLIHESYSEKFSGDDSLDEKFSALPLEYKLSNIALAKSYADKLKQINCFYSSKDLDLPVVTNANHLVYSNYKDNIECLCREEHARWVREKLALGWKYGTDYTSIEERDRKKIHRCIVPYEQLSPGDSAKDLLMVGGIFSHLRKLESRVKIYNYSSVRKPKLEIAGVGHRFLSPDIGPLREEILRILEEYRKNYHVVVRTCFANGADQLIAECALELGLTVKANLPMEYKAFLRDVRRDAIENGHSFKEEDELRMRHLLAQTVVCKTIEDPVRKYEAASRYIVDKCDVLLALWDGQPQALTDGGMPVNRGGTYDSILYAKSCNKCIRIIPCRRA